MSKRALRSGIDPDKTATCFVFCPTCGVLFLNVVGKYLEHLCGNRIGRAGRDFIEELPRPRRRQVAKFARRVVRVT